VYTSVGAGPGGRRLGQARSVSLAETHNLPETAHVKRLGFAIFCAALVALVSLSSAEGKNGWLSNFKEAQEQAKSSKKLVLVDFTGSDWCGWCIKLDKEVFSTPEFQEYASKNLVLMEADFPRRKELPSEVKSQNERLAQDLGIQGFPTLVVFDSEGKKLAEFGYEAAVPPNSGKTQATPQAFIARLEQLRKG